MLVPPHAQGYTTHVVPQLIRNLDGTDCVFRIHPTGRVNSGPNLQNVRLQMDGGELTSNWGSNWVMNLTGGWLNGYIQLPVPRTLDVGLALLLMPLCRSELTVPRVFLQLRVRRGSSLELRGNLSLWQYSSYSQGATLQLSPFTLNGDSHAAPATISLPRGAFLATAR